MSPEDSPSQVARLLSPHETLANIEDLMASARHDPNPERLQRVLSGLQDRTVPPELYAGRIRFKPDSTVLVTTQVAWWPVELLGVQQKTTLALREMRVMDIGSLFLHSRAELAVHCDASAIGDVQYCLRIHHLQLPRLSQLHATRQLGEWVALPDRRRGYPVWDLRIARELAPLVPVAQLFLMRGKHPGFFHWARMVTLGDVLRISEKTLRSMWLNYMIYVTGVAIKEHVRYDTEKVVVASQANKHADQLIAWVANSGLQLAAA